MKKTNLTKIIKVLLIIFAGVYVICTFVNQQKTLNSYKKTQEYYAAQIDEKQQYQEELKELKNNINSAEYIEKIAREKLDMYLPNERVYIDIDQ